MVLAMHLEEILAELGDGVIGLVTRIDSARMLGPKGDKNFAILNVHVAGRQSFAWPRPINGPPC
jgi:hypothetical protein